MDNDHIAIHLYDSVIHKIFQECDRFPDIETGGRLVGTIERNHRGTLVTVTDLIDAGPDARRSFASFFPDPDYMLKVFRHYENQEPDIEHLGNWHSHYCNGLTHLSSGDIANYSGVIADSDYHPDIFLAILVIPGFKFLQGLLGKYRLKFYLLTRRNPFPHRILKRSIKILRGRRSGLLPLEGHNIRWYERENGRAFLASEFDTTGKSGLALKPHLLENRLAWKGVIKIDNQNRNICLIYDDDFLTNHLIQIELTGKDSDNFPGVVCATGVVEAVEKLQQIMPAHNDKMSKEGVNNEVF